MRSRFLHGIPDPQLLGTAASHGCVRVSNMAALRAQQLAGQVLCHPQRAPRTSKAITPDFVAAFYTLEQAELLFENAWQAMEDIAAVLLATLLHHGIFLREIPEAERDPAVPKRFGFAMTLPPTQSS